MCPFPYDLYKGVSAPQPNSPIDRRDLLNYTGDNTIQSGRYIDPATGDFVVSSTNHFQGMNAVEQSVFLSLNTKFNSSSQLGFGQNFNSIKTITPNIINQITAQLQQALSFQIKNNQITLLNVNVFNNVSGQIVLNFSYINNTIGITTPIQYILQ